MSGMKTVVVFSGAGMSAESGIDTFRDGGGLWEQHRVEDIATPDAWNRNPDLVTRFYNERRKIIIGANPNKAHHDIANMEHLANVHIVTQNIDDLHERAGSTSVHHLHGNIRYSKSSGPNQEKEFFQIDGAELGAADLCPDGYRLRPHVVWFGENVPAYESAVLILNEADILIVVGTSLQVHPAAGLIQFASEAEQKFIVDPNADSLAVPNDFIRVNKVASEGFAFILDKLKFIP
ncbi:MAG: Sir2 family NAD-dependent protein deacetylase [Crocinitomicaceae bacterium]|nr:Sir2 family NAD-dependent protein deacetylase [Crocinitomicaceae bacterium]|tara:strand:+ start:9131 stop:9835 length:705 start_codon:yes stop_codon:yes gene_type:complete